MERIHEILTYIFGSTTLVSIIIAWKSRKSEIKKAEANALETIQGVYDKFTAHTDQIIDKMQKDKVEMQNEIAMVKNENFQFQNQVNALKNQVENYKTNCAQCAHNKISA